MELWIKAWINEYTFDFFFFCKPYKIHVTSILKQKYPTEITGTAVIDKIFAKPLAKGFRKASNVAFYLPFVFQSPPATDIHSGLSH